MCFIKVTFSDRLTIIEVYLWAVKTQEAGNICFYRTNVGYDNLFLIHSDSQALTGEYQDKRLWKKGTLVTIYTNKD